MATDSEAWWSGRIQAVTCSTPRASNQATTAIAASEAKPWPCHGMPTSQEISAAWPPLAEDRLEHPDRHPVNEPTDDPVELGCRIGGGAVRGEPAKGASQAFHGAGLSAGEYVQPFVGEDGGDLVGVVGCNRHKDKSSGPDIVIDG